MIGLPLIMELQDEPQEIIPAALQNEEYVEQIREQIQAAGEPPVFDLRHLLDWSEGDRWAVLAFIAGLDVAHSVRPEEHGEPVDLFVAVLAGMVGSEDVARCGRGIQAALEAAALVHGRPQALPAACDRIAQQLVDLGVGGYTTHRLQQQAERLAAGARVAEGEVEEPALTVRSVLPDAPVPEEAVVPTGWALDAAGIARGTANDPVVIIPAPMLITRRFTEVEGDAEYVRVAWTRDGRWHEEVEPRATIVDRHTVLKLAAYGAPVTSNNAAEVVQYLADFEAHNLEILPLSRVARQLGWQGMGGRDGFLWGETLLHSTDTVARTMTATEPANTAGSEIIFRGADEGDEQLADGFRAAGTWDGWCEAVRPIGGFPRVMFGVYAVLTPPMLEVLGAENFILSYAGATSQGKTITLRIAASCWGCPDEKSTSAAIATWDATRVWFGRAPAVMNHLPLVVDDTKRANDRRLISQMLYDVASGRGRGRGSKEGLARNEAFRTVMLASGEAQITSFSEEGGTRARVLELWGSPFGKADTTTAPIVNRINDGVLDSYGHLGPRFVQFLIENRQRWPEWREEYRRLRQQYSQKAGTNSVASRMAAHLAAISMTMTLVHEAVAMPWERQDVVVALWDELTAEAPEADRALAALRYVLSWAYAHKGEFYGSGATSPSGGWAGRWELEGSRNDPDGYIGFFPHKLDEILVAGGFEPQPIKRLWYDREWLKVTEGKRQYRVRLGPGQPRGLLVAVKKSAIEEAEGPAEAEEDVRAGVPFQVLGRPAAETMGGPAARPAVEGRVEPGVH
jgi:hypothetical protein